MGWLRSWTKAENDDKLDEYYPLLHFDALVIIDKAALGTEQVTGVVASLDSDSLFLVPDEGVSQVFGVATSLLDQVKPPLEGGFFISTDNTKSN